MMDSLTAIMTVLKNEMALADGRIWAFDQKVKIPTDSGLFVVVQLLSRKVVGNDISYHDKTGGFCSKQTVNFIDFCQVDLFSANMDARLRSVEAVAAFTSYFAKDLCAKHSITFSVTPTIRDTSSLESSSMLNRNTIRMNVINVFDKVSDVPYYDTFPGPEITTDPSIVPGT